MSMKITMGVDKIDDIFALSKYSQVSEFFCGVIGDGSDGLYGHRPNTIQYNFRSINELKVAIEAAHSCGRKIFLALNEVWADYHQINQLINKIKLFDDLGFDAFIMNDLSLLLLCKKIDVFTRIHLSSLAQCLNSFSINFYSQLGIVSRIILPHQINAEEFKKIDSVIPHLETEIFFQLYNNCAYMDGLCRYHGIPKEIFSGTDISLPMPCLGMREVEIFNEKMAVYRKKAKLLLLKPSPIDYAGNLFRFNKLGTTHVKLGTRGISLDNKIKLTRFVSEMLSVLEESKTVVSYREESEKIFKKHNSILLLPT